jgi:hypothetical protein
VSVIVVDDEQAKAIEQTSQTVEIRDRQGRSLGDFSRDFTSEEIAEAKRNLASKGPKYTTSQVLDYLQTLAVQ